MLRKIALSTALALALPGGAALAAGAGERFNYIINYDFSFQGPFGRFDEAQLQRGLQIYTEACAACHGLQYVPIRTLADPGGPNLPEDQVRAYAEFWQVYDDELMDFRTATPNDHFPPSGYEGAPDLSLMAKARTGFYGPQGLAINPLINGIGGPEYIASLLVQYTGTDKEEAGAILYENPVFEGSWIAMAPPLWDGQVEFADGSPNDVESMAQDVAAFLMWTAEPKMMARKQAGFTGVLFLTVLAVLLYLTNKRLWAPVKHGRKSATPAV
jgi:ubiquinol-cytochrome c reductase cytochrome c1 subunit